MRLAALTAIWAAVSLLPAHAGDWWDQHYLVYQSITSVAVMWAALALVPRTLWRSELLAVLTLQVVHNAGAYWLGLDQGYYQITLMLTACEGIILLTGCLSTYREYRLYGRCADGRASGSDDCFIARGGRDSAPV